MGYIYTVLLAISMFASASLYAQSPLEIKARNHMAAKEYDLAKPILDNVASDTAYINSCEYWYLKGFLYKELYKRDQASDRNSAYRNSAIEFYEKSMKLDTDGSKKDGNLKGIKYLGIRCFNDAASSLDMINYKTALSNFDRYIKAMNIIGVPESELREKKIQFKLALASVYTKLYEGGDKHNDDDWNNTTNVYQEVLGMDPGNLSANYNLGILFYNRAVDIIMNEMGYDVDMVTLSDIQDRCIGLFKDALPYLINAHKLDAPNPAVTEGLAGIYFSLNEIDKSNYYKELLEKIQNNKDGEPLKIIEEHRQENDWYNWKD
ncbi:MAG: hypothetical protein HRT72_11875 [Flavobacteriales bacterium]|nr:hypothetical protein [Flavobacteriales bacterium]